MGRSTTWMSGREEYGKLPTKSFGPLKRQRRMAPPPVSQSKINLRDEIPEEDRGLIEVGVEVKGRNEKSCEEIEVEDEIIEEEEKHEVEESYEEIEVEDEEYEEEEEEIYEIEGKNEESCEEIEEAAAANNGGQGDIADTVKRSGNGSISVTLTDPELLDCPVCFCALTTPVFQVSFLLNFLILQSFNKKNN